MRARSTAAAVARCQSLDARTCEDLSEIDFGSWSGKCFAELEHDAAWHAFNTARATAVVPDGEHPRDVQHRIVRAIARLTAAHPSDTIALISHADVVRFALLYYDARSLDEYQTFEIDPASVSAVRLSPVRPQILYVNDTTFAAGR
jgi:probable phosphoglycerate mutase